MRVTTPDGIDIVVHELGGAGPAVLLAHATGFHGLVWSPLALALRDRFRCVAFDSRGHGDSGRPPAGDFDWRGFGADVLAVVDGLGLERPLGVGHSSGGTALVLAEEARPGTFAALWCYEPVLVAADPPLGPDPDSWLAAAARRRRDVFSSPVEAHEHYRARTALAALAPAALAAYVEHGLEEVGDGSGVRLKCRPEDEARIYEMATAHDAFVRLGRVGCPVRIARGERSDAVAAPALELQLAGLPRATTEVLPGLGHLGPLEDPEAVGGRIRAFWDEEFRSQREKVP